MTDVPPTRDQLGPPDDPGAAGSAQPPDSAPPPSYPPPASGPPPSYPGAPPPYPGGPPPYPGGPPPYPPGAPPYPPGGWYGSGPAPGGGGVFGPSVYASYGARLGGWLIDAIIVWIVIYLVEIPLRSAKVATITLHSHTGVRSGRVSVLGLVLEVVIVLVYGAFFCGSTRGQTLGMMAVGVRAVDRDTGAPIGFTRALGRGAFEYLMVFVFFLPWVLDMLFPLWDPRSQTLHDKVSRTVVVRASLVPPGTRMA